MQTPSDEHICRPLFVADDVDRVFDGGEDVDVVFWEGGDDSAPCVCEFVLCLELRELGV